MQKFVSCTWDILVLVNIFKIYELWISMKKMYTNKIISVIDAKILKHVFHSKKIYMKRISYLLVQLLLYFFDIFHYFCERLPLICPKGYAYSKFICFFQMNIEIIIMFFNFNAFPPPKLLKKVWLTFDAR